MLAELNETIADEHSAGIPSGSVPKRVLRVPCAVMSAGFVIILRHTTGFAAEDEFLAGVKHTESPWAQFDKSIAAFQLPCRSGWFDTTCTGGSPRLHRGVRLQPAIPLLPTPRLLRVEVDSFARRDIVAAILTLHHSGVTKVLAVCPRHSSPAGVENRAFGLLLRSTFPVL